jgi:hypothetical protein
MNYISHFVFLKNIVKKDNDKIKAKSPQLKPKSPRPLVRTLSRNKSMENFFKFQWSWTL